MDDERTRSFCGAFIVLIVVDGTGLGLLVRGCTMVVYNDGWLIVWILVQVCMRDFDVCVIQMV